MQFGPHQIDDLSRREPKLGLDGIKAGPIFPSHLNDPVAVGKRKRFYDSFCHPERFRPTLENNPWPKASACCTWFIKTEPTKVVVIMHHLQAHSRMDWQEGTCHLQKVRKTLRKPGFCSGEDRNRTTDGIAGKTRHLLSRGADSGALIKVFDNTGLSRPQIADPDLAFIIEAWPPLGPQAKNQMITIARAAGQDGYNL